MSHSAQKISAILLAGGSGKRMGLSTPKQFLALGNKLVIHHSLDLFQQSGLFHEIVVVVEPQFRHHFCHHAVVFAEPGNERQDSVYNGLQQVSSDCEWVLVHDGARPLICLEEIQKLIDEGMNADAATLAVPIKCTLKEGNTFQRVTKTLDRSNIWEIQTPQLVKKGVLIKGFQSIKEKGINITDDVSIAEHLGLPVQLVLGTYKNIKITTTEDLSFAEWLLNLNS